MNKENPADLPRELSVRNLSGYLALRDEIDILGKELENIHNGFLACKPGCSECCMDFRIFPVEFFSILREISGKKVKVNQDLKEGDCPFLVNSKCSIYRSRPIICRTHGLPLLYMSEEGWQLSYCELNFKAGDIPDFEESNTFPQDRYNSKLFMINRDFLNSMKGRYYSDTDLVAISELRDFVNFSNES